MTELFLTWLQSLMDFSNILNASIAASWMVLAVLILRFILKKSPKWVYVVLWGLVAVRLIMPFSIESAFSLIPSMQTIPQEILRYQGTQLSQPAYVDIITNPNLFADVSIELGQTVDRIQWRMVYMTFIWLGGIAVMLFYAIISYLRLYQKIATAVLYKDNVFQSENVDSPFVLGIVNPKIYLPFSLNNQDIIHVIAHENAHIKRKDHWWKLLGFILLAIHWFNPIMWLAYIVLCRDIELACDEKVIKDLGNEQRADYTQALVSCSVNRRMIAACPLAFGEVGVKDRVKSVMNYKKPAFWVVLISVIASIVMAVCFLTNPATSVDERLAVFIDCEIASHNQTEHSGDNFCCLDWQVIGKEKQGNQTTIYMWALYEEYSNENGLNIETGSHLLTAITVEKDGDNYKLIEYWIPEDGSLYKDSIMEKVPMHLWNKAFDSQRYIDEQKAALKKMAEEHFGILTLTEGSSVFKAQIIEIYDNYYLVEPIEGSSELNGADRIEVPMKNVHPSPEPKIRDVIEIEYSGEILETYPARIAEVYSIKVVEKFEKWGLVPMVMVDGELYLDTGFKSTLEKRSDVIDGEITSQVDSSETPSADNQSNFGTGYPYQIGITDGTIEILIDNAWWIFATEDVRQKIQFPAKEYLEIEESDKISIVSFDVGLSVTITSAEQITLITDILSSDNWTEGTADCLSDFEFTVGDRVYLYHLSCGTINDNENNRSLSLDETQKTELNKMIEELYYSMTGHMLEGSRPISLPFLEVGKYIMPLDMSGESLRITRGFTGQYPRHDGLDISGPEGTEIFASADGTVVKVEESTEGDGNHVVIKHENGYYTLYAHCSELIAVEGTEVKQGEVIAKIGCTGNATGNHLHFELIYGYESEQGGLSIDPYNAVAP